MDSNSLQIIPTGSADYVHPILPQSRSLLEVNVAPQPGSTRVRGKRRLRALVEHAVSIVAQPPQGGPALEYVVVFPRPGQIASSQPLAVSIAVENLPKGVVRVVGFAEIGRVAVEQQVRTDAPAPARARQRKSAVAGGKNIRVAAGRELRRGLPAQGMDIHALLRREIVRQLHISIIERRILHIVFAVADQISDITFSRRCDP